MRGDEFQSRVDATRAAREFIWGSVTFSKREFVTPRHRPDVSFYDDRGVPVLAVTAKVNLDLVVIHFDHYGRKIDLQVLPR